jgi:Protein of unknown function (DUF1552)
MKLSHHGVTRRQLGRLLGGAALALPALELFGKEVRAQSAAKVAKFAVFCYTPDGVNQREFWPTGGQTDFTLSPILKPFEAFRDKLLVPGPEMSGNSPRSGSGLAYSAATPQHQAAVTLSARVGNLPYVDQARAVNNIDGPSIDQVIANAVKGDSLFSSLNFGLHPIGGDTPSEINFDTRGTSLKRMATPDEAWNRVFGMPVGQPMADGAVQRKQAAVTDFLHARFSSLRPQLSAYDQQVLDGHLTSLRTYEERLAKLSEGMTGCAQPTRSPVPTDDTSVRTGADTEKLCPFYMDIISAAFACNLTKVASVTFGYPGGGDAGGLRMPWLGFTDPMHFVSHHGNGADKLNKYKQMSIWIATQVASLMQKLSVAKDSDGVPLLDKTIIYWFNRHGDGDAHTNFALPNVLLGGAGGHFKMGRYLQLPATSPTKVLISIANAMGVNVTSFGKDAFTATSGLSALTG